MASDRSTATRLLVAGLAALVAFVVQPPAAGRAAVDDSGAGFCPAASGIPSVTGQVLKFTGSVACFRPGGSRFGSNVAPGTTQERVPAGRQPTLGEPCRNVYTHPVTFTESGGGSQFADGSEFADFSFANNQFQAHQLEGHDVVMPGTNDAFVTDMQNGSYERSDPNDPNSPLDCKLKDTFHFLCPGPPEQLDVLCFTFVPHPVIQDSVPALGWGPLFAKAIGDMSGDGGHIHSSPSARGVVNTPVCFWVDDMGIPEERDLTLVLPGGADGSGRQVFYTFLARIRFDRVVWNFDDPHDPGNSTVAPATACGSHPQLTAHQYRQISEGRNGDDHYHVTAVEQYSITVDVFWFTSDGHHQFAVEPGIPAPTLNPTMDPQYVGQVEGIPIGSP